MSVLDFPHSEPAANRPGERRRTRQGSTDKPHRRLNDTAFNRLRWPTFVYAWFILGFALLLFLIRLAFGS